MALLSATTGQLLSETDHSSHGHEFWTSSKSLYVLEMMDLAKKTREINGSMKNVILESKKCY